MKLTEHFTLEEFVRSDTAAAYKIDNTPGEKEIRRLKELCETILEPLRVAIGKPINVTSGYRCKLLNSHPDVKGSANSDHMYGMAADIVVYKRDAKGAVVIKAGRPVKDTDAHKRLFELAIGMNLPFKQLIDEYSFSWVHVSYQKESNIRQILRLPK